jgi:hypothetical protein
MKKRVIYYIDRYECGLSTPDNGGPAFPEGGAEWDQDSHRYEMRPLEGGMTLRDYFAAHAPQMPPALNEIAKMAERQDGRDTSDYGAYARLLADWRWAYANAMLKARQS